MVLKAKQQVVFEAFVNRYNLSRIQAEQFLHYLELLMTWNKKINLTAITDVIDAIRFHFDDSLRITEFFDFTNSTGLADIGTGGGFPGIPLKILFPQLPVVLIEVVQKKVAFLQTVIDELHLENIEVAHVDWRTFLRNTDYNIDVFTARASLQPEDLVRVFSPVSPYNKAQLIYWASQTWQPSGKISKYIKKEYIYEIGDKQRKYVFLQV